MREGKGRGRACEQAPDMTLGRPPVCIAAEIDSSCQCYLVSERPLLRICGYYHICKHGRRSPFGVSRLIFWASPWSAEGLTGQLRLYATLRQTYERHVFLLNHLLMCCVVGYGRSLKKHTERLALLYDRYRLGDISTLVYVLSSSHSQESLFWLPPIAR